MKGKETRTCHSCGCEISGAMKSCPVCMLRQALDAESDSGELSSEYSAKPQPELVAQRLEHYELVNGENGKPIELGRGAMGVTYKAFDVDLRCPVTLKLISERYLGDESAQLQFCARRARRPVFVIRTSRRYCTWGGPGTATFMRWSLWRGKLWRVSSNAPSDLK